MNRCHVSVASTQELVPLRRMLQFAYQARTSLGAHGPHAIIRTCAWLRPCGWKIVNHPPYSPDLMPWVFHLIGKDTEGRSRGPIVTLSWSLPGKAKENDEMPGKIEAQHKISTRNVRNAKRCSFSCTALHSCTVTCLRTEETLPLTSVGVRQDTQYLRDLSFQTNTYLPTLKLKGDFRFL